jgi:hypothetical protein
LVYGIGEIPLSQPFPPGEKGVIKNPPPARGELEGGFLWEALKQVDLYDLIKNSKN